MADIDEIINEARDAREVKRVVSVKMSAQGFSPAQICQVLNVLLQYVSKWKGRYEAGGGAVLRLWHRGSESYLGAEERRAILQWIGGQERRECRSRARLCRRAIWGGVSLQASLLRVMGSRREELPPE
jgi:transposase